MRACDIAFDIACDRACDDFWLDLGSGISLDKNRAYSLMATGLKVCQLRFRLHIASLYDIVIQYGNCIATCVHREFPISVKSIWF